MTALFDFYIVKLCSARSSRVCFSHTRRTDPYLATLLKRSHSLDNSTGTIHSYQTGTGNVELIPRPQWTNSGLSENGEGRAEPHPEPHLASAHEPRKPHSSYGRRTVRRMPISSSPHAIALAMPCHATTIQTYRHMKCHVRNDIGHTCQLNASRGTAVSPAPRQGTKGKKPVSATSLTLKFSSWGGALEGGRAGGLASRAACPGVVSVAPPSVPAALDLSALLWQVWVRTFPSTP